MNKPPPNPDILEKAKKAMKEMSEKGRHYKSTAHDNDGEPLPDGPDFGPRDDIEYRKLIKEIRDSGENDE